MIPELISITGFVIIIVAFQDIAVNIFHILQPAEIVIFIIGCKTIWISFRCNSNLWFICEYLNTVSRIGNGSFDLFYTVNPLAR